MDFIVRSSTRHQPLEKTSFLQVPSLDILPLYPQHGALTLEPKS